jgi:EAL domain-containing protein (putative c-di-GMP-specific phosphodiesterase class I)
LREDGTCSFCVGLVQFFDAKLRKDAHHPRGGSQVSNNRQMPTSTASTSHRLVFDTGQCAPSLSWSGERGGLDSSAGLPRRPWLERLRRALREESFVLHYQPILSLRDGTVDHYEALVRLDDDPDAPPLAPGAWLPAAERYGLIREIDRLVVSRAVGRLAGELESDVSIAVNLSALSIVDRGMLAHIERELVRHCVAPERLTIEVTETAAISDMARAVAFCRDAAALGCALALDDFGVGFGSFHYVKLLPFSHLKIDGEFIRGLCASAHDRLMVEALVRVARGMSMRTTAEFVGDGATVELLRALGVDYAQGFHIGRPEPEIGLTSKIRCARL